MKAETEDERMEQISVLVADDDREIVESIAIFLKAENYDVIKAYNGREALEKARENSVQLIILDIMMPEMDGFTLGKKIREIDGNVPFVYITAKSMKEDMKQGYEIGADDYIVKPFDSEVLILKIKAILSRSKHEEAEPKPKFITIGEYVFNTELRTITKNEEQIKLTPKEARLLELLYNYKDGLLPREKALTEIWGTNDYFTARSMDVYVTKLRKYFKDDQNIKIENVHGSGFRLVIEE